MRLQVPFFVTFLALLGFGASAGTIDCGVLLQRQLPHSVGPQLTMMNKLADRYIEKIANDLNPINRIAFYRQVGNLRASESVTYHGEAINLFHQLLLNPLLIDHPMTRLALVHEATHLADFGPIVPSFIGNFIRTLNLGFVEKMESRAFAREYDYLSDLLHTSGFDANAALAEVSRKPIPEDELRQVYWPKFKLDEPVLDGFNDRSIYFRRTPEKFYRDEGARATLSNYFLNDAANEFRARLNSVQTMTKEEYIRHHLQAYVQRINQGRLMTYVEWGVLGFCSLILFATTGVGN